MAATGRLYFGPHHWYLATGAVLVFLFGANEIIQRLLIEVDGTIISSETTTGNRPSTTYVIRGSDGSQRLYIAGPTDQSLPRRLPQGTHVSKRRYELPWRQNGQLVNDFPLYFYVGACGLGGMLAYWAFFQWRLNRPNRIKAATGRSDA
jgi:hypothetical protein